MPFMYYSQNSEEYQNLLKTYKIAENLQVCIGLDTSINTKSNRLLNLNWNDIKNNIIIDNENLYEANMMDQIFIRPHFDIDFKWNAFNQKLADDVLELAIYKIMDHFDISKNDISIAQNHRDEKCSFHLVLTNIMTTMESMIKWKEDFKTELTIDSFDFSIYRAKQNKWRMVNSKKICPKTNNIIADKIQKLSNHNYIDYLITYTDPSIMKIAIYNNEEYAKNNNDLSTNSAINTIFNADNLDEILEKLSLIPASMVDNYNDTITFIWSCVSTNSNEIINKCREICKLNPKYNDDPTWFDTIVSSYDINNKITIGTALYMAKKANPEQFKLIGNKYYLKNEEQKLIYKAIKNNFDYDIANYFNFKFPNNILSYKTDIFIYDNGKWKYMDDNNYKLKRILATDFYDIFENKLNDLINKLKYYNELEDKKDENIKYKIKNYKNLISNVDKICSKLKHTTGKESIIKELYICTSHDNIIFDSNEYYLNFLNGTLNLQTKEFMKHNPIHYITKQIPFNYEPNKFNNIEKLNLFNKLLSFFPTKEELDYVLWRISKCFQGKNLFQQGIYWIGDGRNGKGIMIDLVSRIFGDYFETLNISYITNYDKNPNVPNAELLKLKGCRLVSLNEPDIKKPINSTKFKSLTGDDYISARDLYKNSNQFIKFKPQFTLFFLTNSQPTFTNLDEATISRLCIVNFPYYFGKENDGKYDSSNPLHKPRNDNLASELRNDLEVLLSILLYYYYINNIPVPECISQFQKNMILEMNPISLFCNEYIENDLSGGRIGISDLFEKYKVSSFYTTSVETQKYFTEKIKNIFKDYISDKRYTINNIKQYVLNNKKYIEEISIDNDIFEFDED